MARGTAIRLTLLLLSLYATVVVLRVAGILEPGFTSGDWFQLATPPYWFVLGVPVGYAIAAPRTPSVPPMNTVSFTRILVIRVPARQSERADKPGSSSSTSSNDDSAWLLLLGALIAVVLLAWGYVEGREVALGFAGATLSVSLGLTAGVVIRRVQLGWFAGDWLAALAGGVVLGIGAIACGYVLLHPPAGPPSYSVLFDAYRQEGLSAFKALDALTRFSRIRPLERWPSSWRLAPS